MISLKELMPHFYEVSLRNTKLWYSYETLIGFQNYNGDVIVIENTWGKTTGKHINYVKNNYGLCTQLNKESFEIELSFAVFN